MLIKKKAAPKKQTIKKIDKLNIKEIKKDLVDDLDQFLFAEEDVLDAQKAREEKEKALAKLDKLIKQELSYDHILDKAKKDIIAVAQEEIKVPEKQPEPQAVYIESVNEVTSRSSHVLDLRQTQRVQKRATLDKYKSAWQQGKEKLTAKKDIKKQKQEPTYHLPKLPTLSLEKYFYVDINLEPLKLKYFASKMLIFALVMAVILLPIRGLVFFGKLQDDKDKLLQFGKQGLVKLQAGVISASENSYEDAQIGFEDALLSFDQAQRTLDNYQEWMLEAAGTVPVVGKQLSLSRNMLTVANNISQAGSILNQSVQEDTNLTEYLSIVHNQVKDTLPYLKAAQNDLQNISISDLPLELRPHFDGLKNYLPTVTEDLESLDETFSLLVGLLGHDSEKRYLILFQNNNELRATGGFIGSFSLLDVYQGKIVGLETPGGGTYDLDAGQKKLAKAPKALSLINQYFNIWDANWWPDYPTSAKKIEGMYEDASQSSIDGVIAINASVLKNLLEVIGPIELEEYQVTITAENLFTILQQEVELNYDKDENKPKAIIADLVPKVLEQLLSGTEKQPAMMTTLAKMLANKQIQIYSDDSATQKKLGDFGWAGKMASYDKDYLNVISTNIAGGKTDNDIFQAIDHKVEIASNGEMVATVKITRTNQGSQDNPLAGIDGGNVSYMRIYTPLGSKFIESIGFDKIPEVYFRTAEVKADSDPDIAREEDGMLIDGDSNTEIYQSLDKTVFANWMTLAPGESKTVMVKYKLPTKLELGNPLVTNWWDKILMDNLNLDNYNLVIQSQSGAQNTTYNATIVLPPNFKVVWNNASDKDSMSVNETVVTYSQSLEQDQYLGFIISNNR